MYGFNFHGLSSNLIGCICRFDTSFRCKGKRGKDGQFLGGTIFYAIKIPRQYYTDGITNQYAAIAF